MTTDIRTVVCPLPSTIKAYTARVNGYYTIVINESLSEQARYRAYTHEIHHIENDDFFSNESADSIEEKAHKKEDHHANS